MQLSDLPAQTRIEAEIFYASGDFGFYDEDQLDRELNSYTDGQRVEYVIDVTGVTYLGSRCIRLIADAMQRAVAADASVVVRAKPRIHRLFDMAGLSVIAPIELVPDA